MTSRIVKSEIDRDLLIKFIKEQKLPFTVTIAKGRQRTTEQNKLQRLWMKEIAEQSDDFTPEECRAYCKLTIGIPLLRAENEAFCQKYDAIVKPLTYEQKMAVMAEPLDMPVTRMMTASQKSRYLDAVYKHFTEKGFALTLPPQRDRTS